MLSITAAGQGLTLTAASTVVFGELHWTPSTLIQAEDRAHRIGQKAAVNIHYLCARNTVDDYLWASLQQKLRVATSALDGMKISGLGAGQSPAVRVEEGDSESSMDQIVEFAKEAANFDPADIRSFFSESSCSKVFFGGSI